MSHPSVVSGLDKSSGSHLAMFRAVTMWPFPFAGIIHIFIYLHHKSVRVLRRPGCYRVGVVRTNLPPHIAVQDVKTRRGGDETATASIWPSLLLIVLIFFLYDFKNSRARVIPAPPGHRFEVSTALIASYNREGTAVSGRVYRNYLLHRQSGTGGGFVIGRKDGMRDFSLQSELPVNLIRVLHHEQLHISPKQSFPSYRNCRGAASGLRTCSSRRGSFSPPPQIRVNRPR